MSPIPTLVGRVNSEVNLKAAFCCVTVLTRQGLIRFDRFAIALTIAKCLRLVSLLS